MPYTYTLDEKGTGNPSTDYTQYSDAGFVGSASYVLGEGTENSAFGFLIPENGFTDKDTFYLGTLFKGTYTFNASDNPWFNGSWSSFTPIIQVVNSFGIIQGTSTSGSLVLEVVTPGDFYVTVEGSESGSSLYSLEYQWTQPSNSINTSTISISGEIQVGAILTLSGTIIDANGTEYWRINSSQGQYGQYDWYVGDEKVATTSFYEVKQEDLDQVVYLNYTFIDDAGHNETVSASFNLFEPEGLNLDGDELANILTGEGGPDTINGFAGNDMITGLGGDDVINGGDGIDTAVFSEELGNYVISRADNVLTVVGPEVDGTDTLTDVERLSFSDISLAFDLDGSAGDAARLLAVALGKDNWYDKALMGVGIDIFDNSGLTFEEIATLALDILLGTARTNKDVFTFIVNNVVGVTPTQADYDTYLPLLENGTFTQSSLFVAAAEHPINDANIGLVGLIESGVEFYPV